MAVVRVACGVSLRIELYDELDSPEARKAAEAAALATAVGNVYREAQGKVAKRLNADPCDYEEENGGSHKRPFVILQNLAPLSFSVVYNSFRRADEFECVFPLALFPVPPEAIRVITCFAVLRQMSADDWEEGLQTRGMATPALAHDFSNADFAGIASAEAISIGEGLATIKLSFRDYLGLLSSKKVRAGAKLDRKLPLSKAIAQFLVGTPAEGLCVKWVDPKVEPTVDQHIPKSQKNPKKPSSKPASGQQNYLDVIVEECGRIGCVPRVNVTRLELSYAGPLYEGRLTSTRGALLVGQVVEGIEAEHQLVGMKTEAVQTVGHNPDTGESFTARWPPDTKGQQATVVEPGKPPRLPPVQANIGLPGYEQLDESVLLIPVGPIASKDRLLDIAQMIFLERTRQRVKYTIKTHAPWSNPLDPDAQGGDLLRLRAGDTVTFGYLAEDDNALLPPEVRALTGEVGRDGMARLLEASGVAPTVAQQLGQLLTSVPRLSKFRVDELHVAGSDKGEVELTFKLVNFVQIVQDLSPLEKIEDAFDDIATRVGELAVAPLAEVEKAFAEIYKKVAEVSAEQEDAMRAKADGILRTIMRNR